MKSLSFAGWSRCLAIALVANVALGCEWWRDVQRQRDQNIQAYDAPALLDGYTGFRTIMSDGDASITWFEYRLPESVDVNQATSLISDRIRAHDGCFQTMELAPEEARLRCPKTRSRAFREYTIVVIPQQRKVVVMSGYAGTETELKYYPKTLEDFKKVARGTQ